MLHWAWCGISAKIKAPLLTSAFMIISSLISQWKKLTGGLFCIFILQLSQPEFACCGAGSQGPGGESDYKPKRDSLLFWSQKTCMCKDQTQWEGKDMSVCYFCSNILRYQQQNKICFCRINNTRLCTTCLKARLDTSKRSLLSSCMAQAGRHLFRITLKHNFINYDYCDY